MQEARQLDCRVRFGELRDHGRREVLDVGDLDHLRLAARLDPDRVRAERTHDSFGDDALLAPVLVAAQ